MINKLFISAILFLLAQNGFAAGLKLIKSQNDELCNHIQSIFQNDSGEGWYDHVPSHKEYNWVVWEAGEYLLVGGLHPRITKYKSTEIDINNDGNLETIWIKNVTMFNREGDELLVVSDSMNKQDHNNEYIIEEIIKMPGIKVSGKWPYRLDIESLDLDPEFYKRNTILGFIDIYPFRFKGKIYLSLVEKYQVEDQPKWHVIVKYLDEQFPIGRGDRRATSKLEHICYFDHISSDRER